MTSKVLTATDWVRLAEEFRVAEGGGELDTFRRRRWGDDGRAGWLEQDYLPTLTEEEARHYWLTHHGPLVRSHAEAAGTLCYRHVHRANSPMDEPTQALRGTEVESYLGHAEAWLDRGRAPGTEEARRAGAAFVEDEHHFIDMERSTIFFGKEHTIIDRR